MAPAGEKLANAIKEVYIRKPHVPVVSNVTAQPHGEADSIADLLVRQVSNSVHWEGSMRWMLQLGVDKFYEFAPSKVLTGLMKKIAPDREVVAL